MLYTRCCLGPAVGMVNKRGEDGEENPPSFVMRILQIHLFLPKESSGFFPVLLFVSRGHKTEK